jgi:nucleoside-diphosphate-sugar epimerase
MRVFVTGASGWIGSAVVPELIAAGHEVLGLARSDASVETLAAAGAEVHRGSLDDHESLRAGTTAADGVIHLAFRHDLVFSGNFAGAIEADRQAIEIFGDALAGSGRPFLIASGTLGIAPGHVATERDRPPLASASGAGARQANAQLTLALASRGVRASVVRLPPTCHGDGDQGFMAFIVGIARDKGVSGFIGDGASRWPAVHRLDAARVFSLGLEQAPAGSVLHAVADEGVPIRDIAEVIGRQLDLPVASIAAEDADEHFGFLGHFLATDSPASSSLTRELLGWEPAHVGLIEDLDEGHYFRR